MTTVIIPPKGFTNIGACCWWNSLLQALLSCNHFVSTLLEENDSQENTYRALKSFVQVQAHSAATKLPLVQPNTPVLCADNITLLRVFLAELREKEPVSFKVMASGQQSASEGFSLLIDILKSDSINALFMHSYEQSIIRKDNSKPVSTKRTTNNFFSQFDEADLLQRGLRDCLLGTTEDLKDYKIEDTGETGMCVKVLKLKRISPIFIVLLNRYKNDRSDISLPETITINAKKGGTMVFYRKSCVDQIGTLGGGHYIARAIRSIGDDSDIYLFNDTQLGTTRLNTVKNTYFTCYESVSRNI